MKFLAIVLIFFVICNEYDACRPRRPRKPLTRRDWTDWIPYGCSDARLAELETKVALSKMKGKLVVVKLGLGLVDPVKVGRKRRSLSDEYGGVSGRDL